MSAALYYVAHSALAGACLFLVCGAVAAQRGEAGDAIRPAVPLQRPQLTALLFLLAGVAMAGLPPLSGFLGKAMLLQATSAAHAAPWIWAVILASSFLAILALLRAGLVVFWSPRVSPPSGASAGASRLVAPVIVLSGVLALALGAEPVKRFTDATAAQLVDSGSYIAAVLGTGGRP